MGVDDSGGTDDQQATMMELYRPDVAVEQDHHACSTVSEINPEQVQSHDENPGCKQVQIEEAASDTKQTLNTDGVTRFNVSHKSQQSMIEGEETKVEFTDPGDQLRMDHRGSSNRLASSCLSQDADDESGDISEPDMAQWSTEEEDLTFGVELTRTQPANQDDRRRDSGCTDTDFFAEDEAVMTSSDFFADWNRPVAINFDSFNASPPRAGPSNAWMLCTERRSPSPVITELPTEARRESSSKRSRSDSNIQAQKDNNPKAGKAIAASFDGYESDAGEDCSENREEKLQLHLARERSKAMTSIKKEKRRRMFLLESDSDYDTNPGEEDGNAASIKAAPSDTREDVSQSKASDSPSRSSPLPTRASLGYTRLSFSPNRPKLGFAKTNFSSLASLKSSSPPPSSQLSIGNWADEVIAALDQEPEQLSLLNEEQGCPSLLTPTPSPPPPLPREQQELDCRNNGIATRDFAEDFWQSLSKSGEATGYDLPRYDGIASEQIKPEELSEKAKGKMKKMDDEECGDGNIDWWVAMPLRSELHPTRLRLRVDGSASSEHQTVSRQARNISNEDLRVEHSTNPDIKHPKPSRRVSFARICDQIETFVEDEETGERDSDVVSQVALKDAEAIALAAAESNVAFDRPGILEDRFRMFALRDKKNSKVEDISDETGEKPEARDDGNRNITSFDGATDDRFFSSGSFGHSRAVDTHMSIRTFDGTADEEVSSESSKRSDPDTEQNVEPFDCTPEGGSTFLEVSGQSSDLRRRHDTLRTFDGAADPDDPEFAKESEDFDLAVSESGDSQACEANSDCGIWVSTTVTESCERSSTASPSMMSEVSSGSSTTERRRRRSSASGVTEARTVRRYSRTFSEPITETVTVVVKPPNRRSLGSLLEALVLQPPVSAESHPATRSRSVSPPSVREPLSDFFDAGGMSNHPSYLDSSAMPNPRQSPSPGPQSQPQQHQTNGGAHNNSAMTNGIQHAGQQADINYLWNMVQELSEVLAANRAETARIIDYARRMQTAAAEQGVSPTIEQVSGELNASIHAQLAELITENQAMKRRNAFLESENEKEVELNDGFQKMLQDVLEKVRPFAYAHEMNRLALKRHYNDLLQTERDANLQLRLEHSLWQESLGRAIEYQRKAMACMDDEDERMIRKMAGLRRENIVLRRLVGWEIEPDSDDEEEAREEEQRQREQQEERARQAAAVEEESTVDGANH